MEAPWLPITRTIRGMGPKIEREPRPAHARKYSKTEYLDMPDPTRKPQNNAKSIDRWDNEGGAPSGGGRSARKRPRATNLQKKAAAKKSPKKKAQWPGKRAVSSS